MKGSITKRISLALAAVFAVGALSLCGCAKNEKSGTFDETNIVLSFSAMSDIHQQKGKTQYADKLVRALDYAEELNGGPLDVALFAGDLTEETWRQNNDDYSTEYNADVAMLKETLERSLNLEETAVFYALGNHDTDPSRLGVEHMGGMAELFYRQLGEKFFWVDAADSEPEIGRRHAVVNGYHFLSVQPDEYWTLRGYSDETLSWIDAQLKKITAENPEQYVFVAAHPPVYGTVFGSYLGNWADLDLSDIMEKYPQVIYFSGHIHNVLQEEAQISQNGAFTAIDCGSVKYTSWMNNLNDSGTNFDNSVGTRIDDFSQGLLVQADGNGNVRVTRCNYYTKSPIKDPWELSYPKSDKSHLAAYDNEAREKKNEAPMFAPNAKFEAKKTQGGLSFSWDAATDDDMVRYYRIVVYETKNGQRTKVESYNLATFTYRYDRAEDMPTSLSYEKEGEYPGEYECELYAVDVWGAQSGAVTSAVTA